MGGGATKKPSCSHTRDCVGCRAISASMVSSTIRASKYSSRRKALYHSGQVDKLVGSGAVTDRSALYPGTIIDARLHLELLPGNHLQLIVGSGMRHQLNY